MKDRTRRNTPITEVEYSSGRRSRFLGLAEAASETSAGSEGLEGSRLELEEELIGSGSLELGGGSLAGSIRERRTEAGP